MSTIPEIVRIEHENTDTSLLITDTFVDNNDVATGSKLVKDALEALDSKIEVIVADGLDVQYEADVFAEPNPIAPAPRKGDILFNILKNSTTGIMNIFKKVAALPAGYSLGNRFQKINSEIFQRVDGNLIDMRTYGVYGDNSTDPMPGIIKALDDYKTIQVTLYFPNGIYKFNSMLLLENKNVILKGDGTGTQFNFPHTSSGIHLKYTTTGATPGIENIKVVFRGPSAIADECRYPMDYTGTYGTPGGIINSNDPDGLTYITLFGIKIEAVTHLINVSVQNCHGHAFVFLGNVLNKNEDYPVGSNSSLSYVERCRAIQSRGSGVLSRGGDANQITFWHCDFRDNQRWGYEGKEFLGNHLFGCHFTHNGIWHATDPTLARYGHATVTNANSRTCFFGCYGEGQPNTPIRLTRLCGWYGGINESGQIGGLRFEGNTVNSLDFVSHTLSKNSVAFTSDPRISSWKMDLKNVSGTSPIPYWSMQYANLGNENRLWEFWGRDATVGGRKMAWAGHGFKNLVISDRFVEYSSGLTINASITYQPGDKKTNKQSGTHLVREWICAVGGLGTESKWIAMGHGYGTMPQRPNLSNNETSWKYFVIDNNSWYTWTGTQWIIG